MTLKMFYIAEDFTFQLMNPGVYSLTLNPNECVPGELVFKPTEVGTTVYIHKITTTSLFQSNKIS